MGANAILQCMLKMMFVYYFDVGVRFCGENVCGTLFAGTFSYGS